MGTLVHRRVVALLACGALTAACGGRMSDEDIALEAAADPYLVAGGGEVAASGGGARTGTGGSTRTGSGGSSAGVTGSGGSAGGDGVAAAATGDGGGPATTLPPGGNGGATDVGVTEDTIVIGNVSTLTGPVPGLFRGALVGTQAWAEMINSQGGINGRTIEVRSGDDALDSGKNRAAHLALKDEVFAFVGSFSVTDDGATAELGGTNIPDLGVPLAPSRFDMPNNFSVSPRPPGWETGPARYYIEQFGQEPVQNVAFFVSAVETARIAARQERQVLESLGYRIVYTREVQPNEPNYTGDVIQMRRLGVQAVMWEGQADQMANLVNAMADQGFTVPLLNTGSTSYSEAFLTLAGESAEGARVDLTHELFLDPSNANEEVQLFLHWMEQVDPDQDVDLFAVFAWAEARLFEQALRAAPAAVTRDAVLAALGQITTFDANGFLAPANPAGKEPTNCFVVVRIEGGQFVREHPAQGYDCTTGGFQRV